MGIFGWSYPPGCSGPPDDYEHYRCDVCGQHADDCECPECPNCGQIGAPACYGEGAPEKNHGLVRSVDQCHSLAHAMEAERVQAERDRAEGEYWADPQREVEAREFDALMAEEQRRRA